MPDTSLKSSDFARRSNLSYLRTNIYNILNNYPPVISLLFHVETFSLMYSDLKFETNVIHHEVSRELYNFIVLFSFVVQPFDLVQNN